VPIYAFSCTRCGPFDLFRPMAVATAPARCPACGAEATRVLTPPCLAILTKPLRSAFELEEKSAHEPDVVSAKTGRRMPRARVRTPPWAVGG
jgi:putative FmdB family regulatory protein